MRRWTVTVTSTATGECWEERKFWTRRGAIAYQNALYPMGRHIASELRRSW